MAIALLLLVIFVMASDEEEIPGPLAEELRSYLDKEEVIAIKTEAGDTEMLPIEMTRIRYIEVVDSCDHNHEGECVMVYAGPGEEYETVARLRQGMVLRVGGQVVRDGTVWYQITFSDQWLRYPERVESDWYVKAEAVKVLYKEGEQTAWEDGQVQTEKKIIVDRSRQRLSAYEGEDLFMEAVVSTGVELTPTPAGVYTVFKKTPSRYMQGPLPNIESDDRYDFPGVPWNLYFTEGGAVIHGAYWHNNFGRAQSHGCVNVPPDVAHRLYDWTPLGTTVEVR